jgi:uncharacterized protein
MSTHAATSFLGVALIVIFRTGYTADAASFDCAKAASAAEHRICDDLELSRLDSRLTELYREALKNQANPKRLQVTQRAWLRQRDRCLKEATDCDIQELYSARIDELGQQAYGCAWGGALQMEKCIDEETEAQDRQLKSLIAQMKTSLVDPDSELVAQKDWEQYREKECRSRDSLRGVSGTAQIQECLGTFAKARIEELQRFHFCDDNGCPIKK